MTIINSFRNEFGFLSNFSSTVIVYEGITYPTAEHAFQAAKSLDIEERKRIASLSTPAAAKAAGRTVKLRKDWSSVRLSVMKDIIAQKFAPGSINAQRLLSTGDATLIEGNTWGDVFWGVCNGRGENHLGKILMAQRNSLSSTLGEALTLGTNISVKEDNKNAITYINGDLLACDSKVIAHCANCFGVMGAGVALAIKLKYPKAYMADLSTKKGDRAKLGTFSKSVGTPTIYNLYGQYNYGYLGGKPSIDYVALEKAMIAMGADLFTNKHEGVIALPRLGAGLAGGDWKIIEALIVKHLCPYWTVRVYSI